MTSIIDSLLDKYNLKDKKLTEDEKQTLFAMVNDIQQKDLTIEKLYEKIVILRNAVMEALIKEPEFNYIFIFKVPNRNQILLKARLEVYMLIEALLVAPKKAKKIFEEAVKKV